MQPWPPSPPGRSEVDVLIPAFNAGATIASAIGSIQNQTLPNISIVVVDDGSTDDTPEILRRLAADDRRIRVVTQANGGIVDALNRGLAECTAEFVARHDADDLAFPDRLEVQLAYLRDHPDCIAVGANAWHVDPQGVRLGSASEFRGDVAPDPWRLPAKEPYLLHPMLMARTEVLRAAGGYRHVFHAEDSDLYWRLLGKGRLHNLEAKLGEYRIHPGSVSSASASNGRIQAVTSQLAALAARRRAEGKPDLPFDRADLQRYKSAADLQGVFEIATASLAADERRLLKVATAAKLLELANRRPYQLSIDDYRFIRAACLEAYPSLSPQQRRDVVHRLGKWSTRLLSRQHYSALAALVPPHWIPRLSADALVSAARRWIRSAGRRQSQQHPS